MATVFCVSVWVNQDIQARLSEPGFSGLVDFQDCEFGLSTFRSYGTQEGWDDV